MTDVWHILLAVACGALYHIAPLLALILTVLYAVYQSQDIEEEEETIKDLTVFSSFWLVGFCIPRAVFSLFPGA